MQLADAALQKYGLFGFLVVVIVIGAGWYVRFITNYFVSAMALRDGQLEKISLQFAGALEKLTGAIDRESKNQLEMTLSYREMLQRVDGMLTENAIQYREIMDRHRDIIDGITILKKIHIP